MELEDSGSNPGGVEVFCTHKEKLIYTKGHELNCLACRARAILPTFVGLCLKNMIGQSHVLDSYDSCFILSAFEA